MRCDAYRGMAVLGERDARRAARHPVVRVGARSAANADEPVSVAPGAGPPARAPAKPLAAGLPRLDDAALGERQPGGWVLLRLVFEAQVNGVHAHGVGQLVNARFQA